VSVDKRKVLVRLACVQVGILAIFVLVALILRNWGPNQELLPSVVSANVRVGDPYDRFLFELGLSPTEAPLKKDDRPGVGYYCVISDYGIGSYFAPQHMITVCFDGQKRLLYAYADWHYRLDWTTMDLPLTKPQVART
jgi:hypothetical protein